MMEIKYLTYLRPNKIALNAMRRDTKETATMIEFFKLLRKTMEETEPVSWSEICKKMGKKY